MNYYIADLHLGHEQIIRHTNRPFADVEEMDKCLIDCWNARVTPADDVFVVGDLIYKNHQDFGFYLKKLKGHIHLIEGNHDEKLIHDEEAVKRMESVDQILKLSDGEYSLFLCHYPVAEWSGYNRGRKHFYGHIHNHVSGTSEFMAETGNAFNVGVDVIGPMPLTAKEIINGYTTGWG